MHLLLEPLLRLFAALVTRGGAPRPDRNQYGPVLVYPLRPGTAAMLLAFLALFCWTLARDIARLHNHQHINPWWLLLACVLAPFAFLLLFRTLTLDEEGIHRRSPLERDLSIPWADLHHVERYQSRSAAKSTYYLRSADDRTTLTLPEMTYNTAHLLQQIRRRTPLPELPRRHRHWWGG